MSPSQVRGDALEATDGDGLSVDAVAPAGRLAGPVAGASEDAREDVGLAVQHVGVVNRPWAISRMYPGTLVCAGQAHWQSTTLWK